VCHGDQFRGHVGFDPYRISGEYRETLNGVLITDHIGALYLVNCPPYIHWQRMKHDFKVGGTQIQLNGNMITRISLPW
jgi:hypothetical protein